MSGATKVSAAGLRLIADFEGFSPVPYNDPVGHCTVGYGELLHFGPCTPAELARPPITMEEGRRRLAIKVKPYADAVVYLSRPLRQAELDALTSLCYNIGRGGYERSGVRAAVNGGGDVCAALRQIIRGTDGRVYPGLVRRREAECAMFNSSSGGDDVFHRLNGRAAWFDDPRNQRYELGQYHMNLGVDFPHLPAEACAVELDIRIDPSTLGRVVLKDGDGSYAGDLSRYVPERIVRVIPGDLPDRRVLFDVRDAPVRVRLVGIVGWW